jgi:predicted homoserine dehydrogenase-like protein
MSRLFKVGIMGSGYISRALSLALSQTGDLAISKILTRRNVADVQHPFAGLLTRSLDELIRESDLVVECTGSVIDATQNVYDVLRSGLPVVTMNAELQVTTGSFLRSYGYLTEAEGDQPGSLASLARNVLDMGFRPRVYGNIKGFLEHHPTLENMHYWSLHNGISLTQVTSFTDGTKIQLEQALVANGLGASIAVEGMVGVRTDSLPDAADILGKLAVEHNTAIADYVLSPRLPAGVFVVAEHDTNQRSALRYLKMGDGPFYLLVQPYHLCHLEIPKTIRRVLKGYPPLLDNSAQPRFGVAAVAKRNLAVGDTIELGIGSQHVRGVAVALASRPTAVPVGLLVNAVAIRPILKGEIITFGDVALPDSLAVRAYAQIIHPLTAHAEEPPGYPI